MQNVNMRFFLLGLVVALVVLTQAESDFFCYQCSDASDNSECTVVAKCPDKSKCLTQIHFTTEGLVMQKRCSKMQMCYNFEENNLEKCYEPDEEFEGLCSYCCDQPGCNKGLPPYDEKRQQDDDGSSSSGGLGKLFNVQSLLHNFNKHPTSGSKTQPKSGPGGKTQPKPGPGGKTQPKSGPGGKTQPKSGPGGKTQPKSGPGGKTLPKPGPGGKTQPKSGPGGKTQPKPRPGGLTKPTSGPGGKTQPKPRPGGITHPHPGGLSKLTTQTQPTSKPPATQPPATQTQPTSKPPTTQPPATQPPATQPPATQPAQTNGNHVNLVNSCHCHAGQPCYTNHANNGQAVKAPVGPGIDVNIHIDLGALLGLNLGTCPCANMKPAVNLNQATVPPPTKAQTAAPTTKPTTVAAPKPQTYPTTAPTTIPTAAPTSEPTTKPTTTVPTTTPTTTVRTTTLPTTTPTTTTPTTTLPTTTPTTTTPTTTTTTTTVPTTTIRPTHCYTCKDKSCYDMNLVACPSDKYFCMNTISQSATGARTFTKECVLEQTCNDKWWVGTAGRPDCFLLDSSPSGLPGMPLDKCSFCCHGDGCNKEALPSSSSLYNPKSFGMNSSPSTKAATVKPPLPQTHPTSSSTTNQPTTVTTTQPTTTTAITTTTEQKTTTSKTTTNKSTHRGNVLSCSVCGDYNNMVPCTFIETLTAPQVSCPRNQFCMTDLVYDAAGTQSLYKRCVTQTQCTRQWYEETSDRTKCTKMNLNNPPLNTVCHFCCKSNGCNKDTIPARSTLYVPKHHQ